MLTTQQYKKVIFKSHYVEHVVVLWSNFEILEERFTYST